MIIDAIEKYKINREKSFLVGDRETDLEAAKNANVRGYLFEGGNLFNKIKEILINFWSTNSNLPKKTYMYNTF